MRAKHIKRIRERARHFHVQHTHGLFGEFESWGRMIRNNGIWVLAYNHHHACERAKRKGYGLKYQISNGKDSERWACWKVIQNGKPDNFRHYRYF